MIGHSHIYSILFLALPGVPEQKSAAGIIYQTNERDI